MASRKLACLTPGVYDEHLPAWSPNGQQLVFSSKRGPDPDRHDNFDLYLIDAKAGAMARPLLSTDVPESAPGYDSRPVWSPDGQRIAFVQGGAREVNDYALARTGRVVGLSSQPQQPAEVFGLDKKGNPTPLSKQNDEWLNGVSLGAVEAIQTKSKDGTRVSGLLVQPVGYQAGRIKTPTLFVCGEKDFNVPLLNTEQMYQALKSLNVPTQLVIYPGQFHGFSTPSYVKDRYARYLAWYRQYLMPAGTSAAGQP